MKMTYSIVTATIAVIAIGAVGSIDYEEEQRQQDEYCQMVRLWRQTKGEAGWPEYRDDVVCGNTKELNNGEK